MKYREYGLEDQELISALAYAGNEGWLADGPREGWMSLTSKGAATMRDHLQLADKASRSNWGKEPSRSIT
jgi:hypothetical protein